MVQQFEFANLRAFLGKRPHDADARQIFLHPAADIGKLRLDPFEPLMNPLAEPDHGEADERRRQDGQQRQSPVETQHDRDREQKGQSRFETVHDARAQQHADLIQIVGGARHNVAGALAREVVRRKADDVTEEVVPEVEFDVARNADQDDPHPELEDAFSGGYGEEQQGETRHGARGRTRFECVDPPAEHQRAADGNRVLHDQAGEAREEAGPVSPDEWPQVPDGVAGVHCPALLK